jgi:hypothetical protein
VQGRPERGFPRLDASVRWGRRQPGPGDAASAAIRFPRRSSSPSRRQVPQGLKPGVHGDRNGPAEAGPLPKPFVVVGYSERLSRSGDRFRRVGGISADRFGSIVSHPSAKNALGWGTRRFGLGEKNHWRRAVSISAALVSSVAWAGPSGAKARCSWGS